MKSLKLHNIHFKQTLASFTQRKIDEGKSKSNITSTTDRSNEFLHFLESRNITNVKGVVQNDINGYFEYLKHRKNKKRNGGLSSAYLFKHREAVLRFMEFVKNVNVGESGFKIEKFEKTKIPQDILTINEVAILFEQTANDMNGIRNRAILSLLYGCGLRKGELHKLDVANIDMTKEVIRIEKSKTAQQRDVPMTTKVKSNLEEYLYGVRELLIPEYRNETAFLINNNGNRLSLYGIQNKVNLMAEQSGIKKSITCHKLRHAIATHLLGDFSIEEIALFLGHRNIDSSQIYTHIKYTKEVNY